MSGRLPAGRFLVGLTVAALAAGCAASTSSSPAAAPPAPTSSPSAALAPPSSGPTSIASGSPAGSPSSPISAVTIYHVTESQFELSAGGPRVLIDVVHPEALSRPATAQDVLLITHGDPDHFDPGFFKSFPGRKVLMKAGRLTAGDAAITGLPAAHNQGDPITAGDATDYIYLVEIGGLRIVHFGDLGQDRLSAEQLAAIGSVDVAFSQLNNPFSGVDATIRKGFTQMNQIRPRLLIPTHLSGDVETAKLAASTWPAFFTTKLSVTLSRDQLPAAPTVLFMAENASLFGPQLKLPISPW